jgi:NAD(P)H-hydrate epimerase
MPAPIISVAQMREWENTSWAAGVSQSAVIRRVGELVARRALQLTRAGDFILILAGQGHNGDDARQSQPHLLDRHAHLLEVTDPVAASPALDPLLARRPALIIDGLFGTGLNRPLVAAWVKLLGQINRAQRPVLAVDIPSGLNADTGAPQPAALVAAVTLTLAAPKNGLLAANAVPFVGRLELAPDFGLTPGTLTSETQWTLPDDFSEFPPPRPVAGHKGTFGHLAILAGSLGSHGAALLAARAAQRAQPGLITVLPQQNVYPPVAAQLQSAMVQPWDEDLNLKKCSAVLIGPGLAAPDVPLSMRNLARLLWRDSEQPVVVDATALDWLPLHETGPEASVRVMTPHPGEAARLLQTTTDEVQADRPAALRELSERWGRCWVVLKGHQTIIGRATGEIFVNPSGNPQLAQGGSGDVLAGYLAGWLAQPALAADPLTAIRYAVWQHGAAADRLTARRAAWVIEDLIAVLGRVKAR